MLVFPSERASASCMYNLESEAAVFKSVIFSCSLR